MKIISSQNLPGVAVILGKIVCKLFFLNTAWLLYVQYLFNCGKYLDRITWFTCSWWDLADLSLKPVSQFAYSDLRVGCWGRQEAADDHVQHGSSTGCLQHGHGTEQTDRRGSRRHTGCDPVSSSAATQRPQIVWEQGKIKTTSYSLLQAGHCEKSSKQSMACLLLVPASLWVSFKFFTFFSFSSSFVRYFWCTSWE